MNLGFVGLGNMGGRITRRLIAAGHTDPKAPVRMPFERSMRDRAKVRAEGFIEVPDVIHDHLRKLAA